MTEDLELNDTGTMECLTAANRSLMLHKMALSSALRVIDILQTVATNSDVGGLMADGENAYEDLQLLLKEINVEV